MLMMSKSLHGRPIISMRSESPIGIAVEPIINPHNLKILGWWCKSGANRQVLLTESVREMAPNGLIIDDESVLSSADELARHREILNIKFQLPDKLVKTKRHKLGKVSDYTFDESMFIQKLYVTRSLTKIFSPEDTLIIGRDQILEVTDHYILVEDADIKATDEVTVTAGAPAAS